MNSKLFSLLQCIIAGVLIWGGMPFIFGAWYGLCGDHDYEQKWLDGVIDRITVMRNVCEDPDLRGILNYTIARYSRAGAWGVMVAPCWGDSGEYKVVGLNFPACPGMLIDPEVMSWPVEAGAMVVVHEAMHDYYPYFGHGHIRERERKLYELSGRCP